MKVKSAGPFVASGLSGQLKMTDAARWVSRVIITLISCEMESFLKFVLLLLGGVGYWGQTGSR